MKYYQIRKPSKVRKSFSLQEETRNGKTRKFRTISDTNIEIINKRYKDGVIDFIHAQKEMRNIKKEYEEKIVKYNLKPVFHNENHSILEKFWKLEYESRELVDPIGMKHEFRRAIEALGSVSIITGSQSDIQNKVDSSSKNSNNQRRIVSRLRTLIKFIGREKDVKLRKSRKRQKKVKHLSENDFKVFLSQVEEDHLKTLFKLAFYSGLRIGEIFDLKERSLKSENVLFIDSQIDRRGEIRETKTKRSRNAYIFDEGIEAFRKWIDDDLKNSDINRKGISKITRKYAKLAFPLEEGKHISFHDLRHSYSIYCLSKGVPLSLVAQSLGNSVLVCQEYYVGFELSSEGITAFKQYVKNSF